MKTGLKKKVSETLSMLESELQILTQIEQGKIFGGSGGSTTSGGPMCDPINSGSQAFIKSAEGYRDHVYDDGKGNLTYGYGHKLTAAEKTAYQNGNFSTSAAKAEALFQADLKTAKDYVDSHLTNQNVTQGQYQAAVDIAYNAGTGALGSSNFLSNLNAGCYDDARNELIAWNAAGSAGADTRISNRLSWYDYTGSNIGSVAYNSSSHTSGWTATHSGGSGGSTSSGGN